MAALTGAVLLVTGCTHQVEVSRPVKTNSGETVQKASAFAAFPDIPMPAKSKINVDKTLIFGTNDTWIGRLTLTAPHTTDDLFDFYRQGLPGYGWEEITSVRALVTELTYARLDRVVTIQIQETSLHGCDVSITVSPRGSSAAANARGVPVPRTK